MRSHIRILTVLSLAVQRGRDDRDERSRPDEMHDPGRRQQRDQEQPNPAGGDYQSIVAKPERAVPAARSIVPPCTTWTMCLNYPRHIVDLDR